MLSMRHPFDSDSMLIFETIIICGIICITWFTFIAKIRLSYQVLMDYSAFNISTFMYFCGKYCTGVEDFVWDCVQRGVTDFFPLHKSMSLDKGNEEAASEVRALDEKVGLLSGDVRDVKAVLKHQAEALASIRYVVIYLFVNTLDFIQTLFALLEYE